MEYGVNDIFFLIYIFIIVLLQNRKNVKFYEEIGFIVLTHAPIVLDKYKLMLSHVPLPDAKIKEGYINLHD